MAAQATKHLDAELFTQPGFSPQRVRMLFLVIRDLRRDAGDFA